MVCYIHTCQTFTSLHRLSLLAAFAQSSPPPVFLGAGAQNHACSHHYPPLSEYIHTSSTTIVSPAPPSLALALSLSLLHHHIIISVNFEKMSVPMRAAALITITNDTTPNTGEEEARYTHASSIPLYSLEGCTENECRCHWWWLCSP